MAPHRIRVVMEFAQRNAHAEVKCGKCKRAVIYPPQMAIAAWGALTDLNVLERRLRCEACGAKEARVTGVWREYHG